MDKITEKNNNQESEKKKNPHGGHRERMRKKYKKGGLEILAFHEILELLLFYSLPVVDTNKIAHELEDKFGKSFSGIFEAGEKRLMEIPGISKNTALFFQLMADVTRLYNIERVKKTNLTDGKEWYKDFLLAYYTGIQVETVVLITLNNRMKYISDDVIYVGSVNSTKVDMNKMVRIAFDKNASAVIVAHNHPNGSVYPSPEDMETTRRMDRLFNEISINFVEHYIVADTKISGIKQKSIYNV